MERFSLFFDSAGGSLPQGLYHLEHQHMGELDIFLVPVANEKGGLLYEAVFNYFKQQSEPPAVAGG